MKMISVEELKRVWTEYDDRIESLENETKDKEKELTQLKEKLVVEIESQALTGQPSKVIIEIREQIQKLTKEINDIDEMVGVLKKSKLPQLLKTIPAVRAWYDAKKAKLTQQYKCQEEKVLEAKEAYLKEIRILGNIQNRAKRYHSEYKYVAQNVENLKPQEERQDLHYKIIFDFDGKKLFKLQDPYNQLSKYGVLGLTEKEIERAFKEGTRNE